MGQNQSTTAGATAFALPPVDPSVTKEAFKLEDATSEILEQLKVIADTLEKRKIGL